MKKIIAFAMIGAFLLAGCAEQVQNNLSTEEAEPVTSPELERLSAFKNCEELNLAYFGGVSKIGAENAGPYPIFPWSENNDVYFDNESLDEDRDGIVCEIFEVTPELESTWPIESELAQIEWERPGQRCGSLEQSREDTVGLLPNREFVVLRCDQNSDWAPRLDEDAKPIPVPLDPKTGFPLETVEAVRSRQEKLSQPVSLKNLPALSVPDLAWGSVLDSRERNKEIELSIEILVSPGSDSQTIEMELERIRQTAKLWGEDFNPTNARIIFVQSDSPSELAWLEETHSRLSLEYMIGDVARWYQEDCGALASNGGGYLTIIKCNRAFSGGLSSHVASHEYTHWYQSQFSDLMGWPNWLVEGGATFYGVAIASGADEETEIWFADSLIDFTFNYDNQLGVERGSYVSKLLAMSSEEFVAEMKLMERMDWTAGGVNLRYLLGSLASEALVATFGHEAMRELYRSFRSSAEWQSSFEDIFGVKVLEFYSLLQPYVSERLELALE